MSAAHGPDGDLPDRAALRREPAISRGELAALGLLVLVAAVMRGYRLAAWPPGLHVDEAFNLLDARAMIQTGWWPVFLPANAGRDVLYSYLQAPLLRLMGESVANARLASAMIGILSIPVFWLTARRLLGSDPGIPPERLRRLAFLAAGFAGLSLWHLHFSRFGIRAVLFPPVVCAVVLAWWEVARPFLEGASASQARSDPSAPLPRTPLISLSLFLGLAFYTHPAGRALVALPAGHALYLAWRGRDARPLRRVAEAFGGAILIATPLLFFWWRHPETFSTHAGEVSILGQGWRALWDNALRVAGMFTIAGDSKPWRNLVSAEGIGRPVFGPGFGAASGDLFFTLLLPLTGLVTWLSALRRARPWAVLASLWLLILLLPAVTTDQAPNFSRSIGALPPAFLLLACGLEWFPGGLRGRLELRPQDRTEALFWNLAALLFLGLFGRQTWQDYRSWMEAPATPSAFDDDKVALANYVNTERAAGNEVYLTPTMAAHPTVRSLLREQARGFDARYGWVLPPAGVGRVSYVHLASEIGPTTENCSLWTSTAGYGEFGFSTLFRLDQPWTVDAGAGLTTQSAAGYGLAGCSATGIAPLLNGKPLSVTPDHIDVLGKAVRLRSFGVASEQGITYFDPEEQGPRANPRFARGATMVRKLDGSSWLFRPGGDGLALTVVWQVHHRPPPDLNIAIQLVDAQGRGIAQADGPPLGPVGGSSSYPTDLWRAGETVITRHQLAIPADAPVGTATLRVGLYDWRTGTPLLSADGQSVLPVARIPIGPR